MSAVDTNTRLLRPTGETRRVISEGRIPDWEAPLTTRMSRGGKHRLNEDLETRRIPGALRERAIAVPVVPVVSTPVPVPVPVTASSSPSKLAMLAANMRRWVKR